MSAEKAKHLMSEFPPVSTEAWEEVIAADLKGADRTKKLVWRTLEGFDVQPYYRAGDLAPLKHLDSQPGQFPFVRGVCSKNHWKVRQTIEVRHPKSANAEALKILMSGVDVIGFLIPDADEYLPSDLDQLLQGIDLRAVEVAFVGTGSYNVYQHFIDKITAEGIDPDQVRATFEIDALGKMNKMGRFPCGGNGEGCMEILSGVIRQAMPYKHLRPINVNASLIHNCGASIVQELAFALAMGHEYIVRLLDHELTVDQIVRSMKFNFSIGTNYFMEIAKLRAARMLWANIVKSYNPEKGCSAKMRIHAETSAWNQTVYDPYVNMLRGTTEAMSAAIAGVDSLEVTPFDRAYQRPTEFSNRMARNVQNLLKEESHFDQVTDPSAGSYYIESLTASIAEQAWKIFLEVEKIGGYVQAMRDGYVQGLIVETARQRDMNIATRRQILLGTNQYPNFTEKADEEMPGYLVKRKGPCDCGGDQIAEQLLTYRGAMAFEEMRLQTDRSGKNPKAFMLTCGTLAFARARSQFSSNFFACAGIEVIDNTFFANLQEGIDAAIKSQAQIVVVCAADDDYAALAPQVYNALKGKAIVVVAGSPASQPELEAIGINHFISVKSNVLETLKAYQKELGI